MSKKGTEIFQIKISRNDRFTQMSLQEKVIEQKKREIQARLDQEQVNSTISNPKISTSVKNLKSSEKIEKVINIFSNDGSFLNQFKQMKNQKVCFKGRYKRKESLDNSYSDDHHNKYNRWSHKRDLCSSTEQCKSRFRRYVGEKSTFEQKSAPKTYVNNKLSDTYNLNTNILSPQKSGKQFIHNIVENTSYQTIKPKTSEFTPSQILLNMPPPQIIPDQVHSNQMGLPVGAQIHMKQSLSSLSLSENPQVISDIPSTNRLPITSQANVSIENVKVPHIELLSIPPPNPIQIYNIPQPEPINTLNIPHPAPLQVQNIPPPSPISLTEIPNPQPIDIINIPTPLEVCNKHSIETDFIKNVPPPNKSVPPPNMQNSNLNIAIALPLSSTNQQTIKTSIPLPNRLAQKFIPPPQTTQTICNQSHLENGKHNVLKGPITQLQRNNITTSSQMLPTQGLQEVKFNSISSSLPETSQTMLQNIVSPLTSNISPIQNTLTVTVVPSITNHLPSINPQPILTPQTINVVEPQMNLSCTSQFVQNISREHVQNFSYISGSGAPTETLINQLNLQRRSAITGFKDINTGLLVTFCKVFTPGTPYYEAMASLGCMVAQFGSGIEDIVKQRKPQDPNLWFLFHKESAAYLQYQQLVQQFKLQIPLLPNEEKQTLNTVSKTEMETSNERNHMPYESISDKNSSNRKRRKKSRWSDTHMEPFASTPNNLCLTQNHNQSASGEIMLSKVTRNDHNLLECVYNTYGTNNLSEEDWKHAEDNYKLNILYQDMMRKRENREMLQKAGKNKYEYDSDEECVGGTWEHKLREKEMTATHLSAEELTKQAEGKHHIGDFLPPEELKRFLEKSSAVKEGKILNLSDYKEFKLKEDNMGFKMLKKLGWSEGQGLGTNSTGIVDPVNKATIRDQNQGLGLDQPDVLDNTDDEYDAYRKRMMLAYRFRPNPLNNPRRPYY